MGFYVFEDSFGIGVLRGVIFDGVGYFGGGRVSGAEGDVEVVDCDGISIDGVGEGEIEIEAGQVIGVFLELIEEIEDVDHGAGAIAIGGGAVVGYDEALADEGEIIIDYLEGGIDLQIIELPIAIDAGGVAVGIEEEGGFLGGEVGVVRVALETAE